MQSESAAWKPPPYIVPSKKDYLPFHCWCVDTIVNLPDVGGYTNLLVMVCASSKWVEAVPTKDRSSLTMTQAFHLHITCRFGVPSIVRVDRGTEYAGDFSKYLRSLGVTVSLISTAHPRSNGLVERYNRVLKSGFRKMA